MGAGKSTALAAAREAGLETIEIDELMERELGKPIRRGLRGGRRGGLPRPRGGGRRRAAGERRRRRDRARRRQRPLRAGARGARAPHRRPGWRSTRPRPGSGSRAPTGRWRRAKPTSSGCWPSALPLYEELADAVVPMADEGVVARALPAIQALRGDAGRDEAALGRRAPRATTRSSSAAGLLDAGWWPLEGAALLRHRHATSAALCASGSSRSTARSRSSRARRRRRWSEVERGPARAGRRPG